MSTVFDDRVCALGEGPLWHPTRGQFFWFDILGKKLLSRVDDTPIEWHFDEHVSAGGWIDENTLLIASETALWRFDIETGARSHLIALEANNPVTRSNDGRADPWGGFWIGSMGKNAESYAGAIYRFYRGELRQLYDRITIANAICFSPDRTVAYYTDTHSRRVMRQPLEGEHGWPMGDAEVFLDLREAGLNPDGAVVDAAGNLWLATWGVGQVAVYSPEGERIKAIDFDADQTSCPGFGGPELRDLYCTTAATELAPNTRHNGMTFIEKDAGQGQREHQVIL